MSLVRTMGQNLKRLKNVFYRLLSVSRHISYVRWHFTYEVTYGDIESK